MALQKASSIDNLPDEILLMIMTSLPTSEDIIRCSMVCHRWQRLTTEETLWKSAKINKYTVIPLKSLAKLVQRGIRSFDLSKVVVEDPESWSRIYSPPTYKSQMTSIDLTEVGISAKALEYLLKPMNELRELHLANCAGRLHRSCCEAISRNKHLRVLDLHGCRAIDTQGLGKILENCQRLEDLTLSETKLTRSSLLVMSSKVPASLLRLDLRDVSLFFYDTHLANIVKLCPKLTHLDVSGSNYLSHAAVEAANAALNLEELVYEPDQSDDEYLSDDFEFGDSDSSLSSTSDEDDSNHVPLSLLLTLDEFHSSSSDLSFNVDDEINDLVGSDDNVGESTASESSADD